MELTRAPREGKDDAGAADPVGGALAPEPPPGGAATGGVEGKVAVARSPTRCPYCHDDCAPEGAVVCEGCLSRHHAACWREGGRCASCQGQRALRGSDPPRLEIAPAELELLRRGATREAVERVGRRAKVGEAVATTALLEAAAAELARAHTAAGPRRLSPVLATLALLSALALLIPIVAIVAHTGGWLAALGTIVVYVFVLEQTIVRMFRG